MNLFIVILKMVSDMKKKAQGQMITIVLIILLILAAIVVIWVVIGNSVRKSSSEVTDASKCFGITLTIQKAVQGVINNVIIERGVGGPEMVGIYLLPENGNAIYSSGYDVKELDSRGFDVDSLQDGEDIKVGARLGDGTLCFPMAVKKVG